MDPSPDRTVQFTNTSAITGVICIPVGLPLNLALLTINDREEVPVGGLWELDGTVNLKKLKVPCPDAEGRMHYLVRMHRSSASGGAGETPSRSARTAPGWVSSPSDWQ